MEFLEGWKTEKVIGVGSYGKVYLASKNLFDEKLTSAIKHITIPNNNMMRDISNIFSDKAQYKIFFNDMVKDFINEISILNKLKGHGNIISFEDYIIKEKDEFGWDIYIRMEYATPLPTFLQSVKFNENLLLKIANDICNGLDFCHKNNIIHRDIKESNLFYSETGNFKIGDFGVSKLHSSEKFSKTYVGTPYYIAPEILKNEKYDNTVDIYSFGATLYKLANNGILPFIDNNKTDINIHDIENSEFNRLKGTPFPKLPNISEEFMNIILKSCQYDPKMRYTSFEEIKNELLQIINYKGLNSIIFNTINNETNIHNTPYLNTNQIHKTDIPNIKITTFPNKNKINVQKINKISLSILFTFIAIVIMVVILIKSTESKTPLSSIKVDNTLYTNNSISSTYYSHSQTISLSSTTPIITLSPSIKVTSSNSSTSSLSTESSTNNYTLISENTPILTITPTISNTQAPSLTTINYNHVDLNVVYLIKNVNALKYLNVKGSSSVNNTNINIYEKDGTTGQSFSFYKSSSGWYTISPLCAPESKLNIFGTTALENSNVDIYKNTDHSTQGWYLEKINSYYLIRSANDPKFVLTAIGAANLANVCISEYVAEKSNQHWVLEIKK